MESVKEVVREQEDGLHEGGLTKNGKMFLTTGFLYLHTLFIQRGRLETTWTVLRRFGYGDDLSLREDYLFPTLEVPSDCTVELSSEGYAFFTDLFQKFDQDRDGALKDEELNNLFSTSPGCPFENGLSDSTKTNDMGAITLQGFLAQW